MGITLGGIMRGALPVLQQGLEAPMQNAVARMDNMGKLYNAKAGAFQKKQEDALNDVDKIKTLADGLGVEIGIAEAAYKMSGKSVDKAGKIINNMLKAFKGNIPTSKLPVTEMPVGEKVNNLESTQKVEIAPKEATSEGIFKSFANLFKMYSPDDVKKMFAERSGIPLEQVDKVLNNTFNLPSTGAKVAPTAEAMRAGMIKPSTPSQSQIDVNYIKKFYMETMNYNEEEATRAANTHVSGGFGLKTFSDGDTVQNIVKRDGTLSTQLVPRFSDTGVQLNPDKKDRNANAKRLSSAENSVFTIAEIKELLFINPQVFTVFGRIQEFGTNLLDVVGFEEAAKGLGGDQVKKAIQKARQFIKTAKEDIFDDPRISDRDLQIINQYIGIIMDDSAFGVGKTNALAAIIGLERAAVQQMALSMYSNTPGLQQDLIYTTVDKSGAEHLDTTKDSVANRVLRVMMKSYGFTAASIAQAAKDRNSSDSKVAARGNYVMQQMDNLMLLAKNSVRSLQARKNYSSEDDFKKQYSNQYINTLQKGT